MSRKKHTIAATLAVLCFGGPAAAQDDISPENILVLELKDGKAEIELLPESAPRHVARIRQLAREGFYDGIVFHRVIPGFMAQTGDPTGTGRGGSSYPDVPGEFSDLPFRRGTAGMARTSDPNSANSQFFICFEDARFLDGQYTVWGRVISGMEFVDRITPGEPPPRPDQIISLRVKSDLPSPEPEQAEDAPPGEENTENLLPWETEEPPPSE